MTDPLSITVGGISLAAIAYQGVQTSCNLYGDYRDAEKLRRHAWTQLDLLHSNVDVTSSLANSKLAAAQSSFEAIEQDLRQELRGRDSNRRTRVAWIFKGKKKTAGLIAQCKDTELSACYTLQLDQYSLIMEARLVTHSTNNHTLLIHFKKRISEKIYGATKANRGTKRAESIVSGTDPPSP
jgi:hypothetical protein